MCIQIQDLRGEIEKIARFLGKHPSEQQLNRMVEHLRIDKFAKNKAVNFEHYRWLNFMNPEGKFIRKGMNVYFFFTCNLAHLRFLFFGFEIIRKNWRLEEPFLSGVEFRNR